jgi:hypothetical protein
MFRPVLIRRKLTVSLAIAVTLAVGILIFKLHNWAAAIPHGDIDHDTFVSDMGKGNYAYDVLAPRERNLLSRFPEIAQRDNFKLAITFKDGSTRVFEDNELPCGPHEGEGDCSIYHLYEINVGEDIAVVIEGHMEGHEIHVFSYGIGNPLTASDIPHPSPSGNLWAIATSDDMNGIWEINVLKRTGETLKLLQSFPDQPCEFESWQSDTSFSVLCEDFSELGHAPPNRKKTVSRIDNGRWSIAPVD